MARRFALVLVLFITSLAQAAEFKNGVVVAVSAPGAEAGVEILNQGGNAVDAAVATALALAVTHPAAGNIGGGGFMMIQPPGGPATLFDYREIAPAASTRDMFLKEKGVHHHRAVGVPGTIRGLEAAHKKFGKLPWAQLVAPAIRLASEGFILDSHHAVSLNKILAESKSFAELQRVFARLDGKKWQPGDRLVQPDLARTMQAIAKDGPDAFYRGPLADMLVAEMKRGGGLITHEDLQTIRAVERKPLSGTYRGYDLVAPPPPSAGGTCLIMMLNMLEPMELKKRDRFSPETLHLMAEAMRRAYCDRARYLGDPAFTTIPDFLTTREHGRKWAASIDPAKATPSASLAPELPLSGESDSTTHFSVIDRDGLAVSNTYTLENSYGARIVVAGAGYLLNNEMGDFNWRPGVTTRTGKIGTEPNLIAPGKKMLSSQTPTIVLKDGKVRLITGSPGGRTITNTVLNVLINVLEYDMPIQEAVDAPRLHHQWFPDDIKFEGTKTHAAAVEGLRKMGHQVAGHRQGDAHSIWINPATGGYVGAADKRLSGAAVGY